MKTLMLASVLCLAACAPGTSFKGFEAWEMRSNPDPYMLSVAAGFLRPTGPQQRATCYPDVGTGGYSCNSY